MYNSPSTVITPAVFIMVFRMPAIFSKIACSGTCRESPVSSPGNGDIADGAAVPTAGAPIPGIL